MAIIHTIVLLCLLHYLHALPLTKDASITLDKPEENPKYVEGDMRFPPSPQQTNRGVLMRGTSVRWTNGIVPYEILPGYAAAQVAYIVATMQKMERLIAINNVACVQFRPKVATDVYFISIYNGQGCSSYVGQNTGVNMTRTVTLQYPGCISEGTIMHELLHALGFYHEQSRPDRDDYVRVNTANIISGMEYNFDKYSNSFVDTQNTSYDYQSVMHYPSTAFSSNGQPTIEPLQAGATIGQRVTMSAIDIQEVRLFYSCAATGITFPPTTTTTTVNLYVVNTTASSVLSTSSSTFTRRGATTGTYYYDRYLVTVPATGSYIFTSVSALDTYGYLYDSSFDPTATASNLLAEDDDSAGSSQFRMTAYLQTGVTYILVPTTYNTLATGSYTVVASGLTQVSLVRVTTNPSMSSTTTTTASTRSTTTTSTSTRSTTTTATAAQTTTTSTRSTTTTATAAQTTTTSTRSTTTTATSTRTTTTTATTTRTTTTTTSTNEGISSTTTIPESSSGRSSFNATSLLTCMVLGYIASQMTAI